MKDYANLKHDEKPFCDDGMTVDEISRFCGEWLAGSLQKFCDECGQKIDWTEQEGRK